MRLLVLFAAVVLTLTSCRTPDTPNKPSDSAANPASTEPFNPAPPTRPTEALPPPVVPLDAGGPAFPTEALPSAPPLPAVPTGLPPLEEPATNPTTPEKVALGHLLFFDKRLSKDGSMACEGCHHIEQAYTSGQAVDAKVGGAKNKRNAPTVGNIGYHASFYWDGRMPTLEAVSNAAWKGQLGADPATIATQLNVLPAYRAHFHRAFGQQATAENIPQALAAFLRALKSGAAPFDKLEAGDAKAVSAEARQGFEVFKNAGCALCHAPPLYTDHMFHNVGVGWDPKTKKFSDEGQKDATKDEKDAGKFKTPPLRDIAKTAPYFHDGSAKTLDAAIDFMLKGGVKNPNLDEKLKPQKLSKKDRAALEAFLQSLSGEYTFTRAPELPK
ncbi:MAG: cytochrome c peroxidase [Myxococcota bacterium]